MIGYGKTLVLDLQHDQLPPISKTLITNFCVQLCDVLDMTRADLHFWAYADEHEYNEAPDHLKGVSAVQFIETSSIVFHSLDITKKIYLEIFSCKDFHVRGVEQFCTDFFNAKVLKSVTLQRI